MITIKNSGNFNNTFNFLKKNNKNTLMDILNKYGEIGVTALSIASPFDSGKTASSWGYKIKSTRGGISIIWTNQNINDGVNIAIILQYGHGTKNNGYVQGIDYINPAIRPIFQQIIDTCWESIIN